MPEAIASAAYVSLYFGFGLVAGRLGRSLHFARNGNHTLRIWFVLCISTAVSLAFGFYVVGARGYFPDATEGELFAGVGLMLVGIAISVFSSRR
jgi:hypothetical protein